MRRSRGNHREGKHFRKRPGHAEEARSDRNQSPQQGERVTRPGNQSRELRELLAGIGTPKPAPFQPDRFQTEALTALEFEDVLVTAPTVSGRRGLRAKKFGGYSMLASARGTPHR